MRFVIFLIALLALTQAFTTCFTNSSPSTCTGNCIWIPANQCNPIITNAMCAAKVTDDTCQAPCEIKADCSYNDKACAINEGVCNTGIGCIETKESCTDNMRDWGCGAVSNSVDCKSASVNYCQPKTNQFSCKLKNNACSDVNNCAADCYSAKQTCTDNCTANNQDEPTCEDVFGCSFTPATDDTPAVCAPTSGTCDSTSQDTCGAGCTFTPATCQRPAASFCVNQTTAQNCHDKEVCQLTQTCQEKTGFCETKNQASCWASQDQCTYIPQSCAVGFGQCTTTTCNPKLCNLTQCNLKTPCMNSPRAETDCTSNANCTFRVGGTCNQGESYENELPSSLQS